jgi:hypothetical protein
MAFGVAAAGGVVAVAVVTVAGAGAAGGGAAVVETVDDTTVDDACVLVAGSLFEQASAQRAMENSTVVLDEEVMAFSLLYRIEKGQSRGHPVLGHFLGIPRSWRRRVFVVGERRIIRGCTAERYQTVASTSAAAAPRAVSLPMMDEAIKALEECRTRAVTLSGWVLGRIKAARRLHKVTSKEQ